MSFVGAVPDIGVRSVLLAYDFSEVSEKALHHALAISRHYGAKFYLAHVVSHLGYTIAGPVGFASLMPWDVAYKVACGAHCPVLTLRN